MPEPTSTARLLALPPSCGPVRLVAVDGPSGSGKTTYARRLAAGPGGAPRVGSDDFRVPWDAPDPLVWWPEFERAVLVPFRAGRPGLLRRFSWHEDDYGPEEEVPPAPVVIVEGVGAAWRGCPAAYRIWVDAPRALRRARVLERDGQGFAADWDAWSERESRHFAADGTRSRADLRVDGTDL